MDESMTTPFQTLRSINVNTKTEKKGNLTYLSWAWAVDQLLTADHTANWTYLEPLAFGETLMVRCAVTAFGITRTAQLPVMDHRNKPIAKPDAFAVNTAMQRCLAKGIALHGLGLYIYAGEDVPPDDSVTDQPEPEPEKTKVRPNAAGEEFWARCAAEGGDELNYLVGLRDSIRALLKRNESEAAATEFYAIKDIEEASAVWSQFDSKERSAIKAFKPVKVAA